MCKTIAAKNPTFWKSRVFIPHINHLLELDRSARDYYKNACSVLVLPREHGSWTKLTSEVKILSVI
jgi:hypothetical protein